MSRGRLSANIAANLLGGRGARRCRWYSFRSTLQAIFGIFDLGLGAALNREMARLTVSGSDGSRERDLIDDAREFTNANGYPSIAAVKESTRQVRPDLRVAVENDLIRINPAARA